MIQASGVHNFKVTCFKLFIIRLLTRCKQSTNTETNYWLEITHPVWWLKVNQI